MGIHILETVEFAICVGFSRKLSVDLLAGQRQGAANQPVRQHANGLGWPREEFMGGLLKKTAS
jgi:hypothetical protein